MESPRQQIRARALALGFDAVGFAPAALSDEAKSGLEGFIAAGYHGDMGWLAEKAPRRRDPQTLWPEARSVVVLGLNYGAAEILPRRMKAATPARFRSMPATATTTISSRRS